MIKLKKANAFLLLATLSLISVGFSTWDVAEISKEEISFIVGRPEYETLYVDSNYLTIENNRLSYQYSVMAENGFNGTFSFLLPIKILENDTISSINISYTLSVMERRIEAFNNQEANLSIIRAFGSNSLISEDDNNVLNEVVSFNSANANMNFKIATISLNNLDVNSTYYLNLTCQISSNFLLNNLDDINTLDEFVNFIQPSLTISIFDNL